ncbi:MAG: hypothetical protein ACO2OO_01470 [Candidatus Aenigmatarchaeota archaeon]|jgi:hypothetical protein
MKLVYIGKNVTSEFLGAAQGTLNALYGFGQLFVGALGGLIWLKFGFNLASLLAAILISISSYIIFRII